MVADKITLRKEMLDKLADVDSGKRKKIEQQLIKNLLTTELWQNAQSIGIYLSFGSEWETRGIIEAAWEQGKRVTIPKTIPETKTMKFYQINNYSQVRKGHFDIEEPIVDQTTFIEKNKIDLLIVPGVVFSADGYRVGFGGGYYDRFLTDFIHPTISLVWSEQLIQTVPTNQYDLPVQYVVTEKEII